MSDIGGLQLLPTQPKKFSFSFSGRNTGIMIAVGFLIIMIIAYVVVSAIKNRTISKVDDIDAQILAIHAKRDKQEEERLQNVQKQITTTRKLLQTHAQTLTLLTNVQHLLSPRIQFSSLNANMSQHTYMFSATADSYTTIARQISAFYGSSLITNIKVSKLSAGETGGVDVGMELTLKP